MTSSSTLADLPTSYPEVNAILERLLAGARAVLGQRLVGLYLFGSLASGGFDPARSDIDFLAAVREELPSDLVAGLEGMHARLLASGEKWAQKLEGFYVPLAVLRRHDPTAPPCARINEKQFSLVTLGSDWIIERRILREQGVVVSGPDPKTLIDPVAPQDLRRAVTGVLREWWQPMLSNPSWLAHPGPADYQAFAVLTMCRAVHTLATGAIASKPAAARWAQANLPSRWSPLIAWAAALQPGDFSDHLSETLGFIRFSLDVALV